MIEHKNAHDVAEEGFPTVFDVSSGMTVFHAAWPSLDTRSSALRDRPRKVTCDSQEQHATSELTKKINGRANE
jgi:hypothetical protein